MVDKYFTEIQLRDRVYKNGTIEYGEWLLIYLEELMIRYLDGLTY